MQKPVGFERRENERVEREIKKGGQGAKWWLYGHVLKQSLPWPSKHLIACSEMQCFTRAIATKNISFKKLKIAVKIALTIPICPLVSYNQVNMN